jgi:hypothetical protein
MEYDFGFGGEFGGMRRLSTDSGWFGGLVPDHPTYQDSAPDNATQWHRGYFTKVCHSG